jgi:DNA-binding CsgD family transcriptional regulator/PAS domain-containing protein
MNSTMRQAIYSLHDAAIHQDLWPEAILQVSDLMSAGAGMMLILDNQHSRVDFSACSRMAPEANDEYLTEHLAQDLRIPRILGATHGAPLISEQLLSEEEWQQNKAVRDYLDRHEARHLVGCNLSVNNKTIWLGIGRKKTRGAYNDAELQTYSNLLPHLEQAVRSQIMFDELQIQRDAMASVLGNADKAMVFLNQDGKVCFCNPAAEGLARQGIISLSRGQLSLCNRSASQQLRRQLDQLNHGLDQALMSQNSQIFEDRDQNQYGLHIFPVRSDQFNHQSTITQQNMVVICNLSANRRPSKRDIKRFASLYGLTEAEYNILQAVASLQKLRHYAEQKNIKVGTAQKYLKSVRQKTGTRSQKELLRRLDRFCFLKN